MSAGSLSHQVEAYFGWKNNLVKEVIRYQTWLQNNKLYSDDIDLRLKRGLKLLQDDELTIAFVGEYSRGKTELINALFFADFGQRMLPSQAGRTTMCPTEIFFDREQNESYLQLLPIESRENAEALGQIKLQPEAWQKHPLDISSPEAMQASLKEVARTLSVSVERARELGFLKDMLDHDPEHPGNVIIPAWRHAMISLDHPLLTRGLRILDTPGLNALGSEPELTISMIPNAHAVIFLLSADTGVTASDLSIWRDYIALDESDHRAGRFAVLNKIDVLWDDLQGETHTQDSIRKVRKYTADHLKIASEDIIPVSAKQALLAKVRKDAELEKRSQLPELEQLISERILAQKEQIITTSFINDILGMLQNSQAVLHSRLNNLSQQLSLIEDKKVNPTLMQHLAQKTQQDYDFYYKKLITLRSSRRLMKSQEQILTQLVTPEKLENTIVETRQKLQDSWTTVGMNITMQQFFQRLNDDIRHLQSEARLAEKMVNSIYQRYKSDTKAQHLQPIPFSVARQIKALKVLEEKATRFRRAPRTILTEQTLVIKRFFSTMVQEARDIYTGIRTECERWPNEALLPIMQYTLEQKQLLEHQIKRLKSLSQTNKSVNSQREQIRKLLDENQAQLMIADSIQRHVRKPAPTLSSKKVVSLPGLTG
ncbi:MAG: dynamin family protein [Hahellaceae bacterium]|nr:dynamin family protein [Hahellaceae bacterium]MCP5168420.1 dynamin family protein [Hahellaceae bacterium]